MAATAFRLLRSALTRGPSEAALAASTSTPRLQTIPYSHYCELGRWALDHARIPYHENTHARTVRAI